MKEAAAPMERRGSMRKLPFKFDIHCSRKRVARLMREAGIKGVHRRKRQGCTRKDPKRPIYPDLVERNFEADAPNKLWVGDITQHPTSEGWLYLAVVLDAFFKKGNRCFLREPYNV